MEEFIVPANRLVAELAVGRVFLVLGSYRIPGNQLVCQGLALL